jgi:hypothetical protein
MNINDIQSLVNALESKQKTPPKTFSAEQILFGGFNKGGLSAVDIAREIIERKQQIGIPIGDLPDGSENIDEKMERIRVEVLLKHLFLNARILIAIPAGIAVKAEGVSGAGVPVTVAGITISNALGTAIIQ